MAGGTTDDAPPCTGREYEEAPVTQELFFVECRTGCTCCQDENHIVGPYSTLDLAYGAEREFHANKRLSSQYAKNGKYRTTILDAEPISRGRFIVGDRVINPESNPMDGGCTLEGWEP